MSISYWGVGFLILNIFRKLVNIFKLFTGEPIRMADKNYLKIRTKTGLYVNQISKRFTMCTGHKRKKTVKKYVDEPLF